MVHMNPLRNSNTNIFHCSFDPFLYLPCMTNMHVWATLVYVLIIHRPSNWYFYQAFWCHSFSIDSKLVTKFTLPTCISAEPTKPIMQLLKWPHKMTSFIGCMSQDVCDIQPSVTAADCWNATLSHIITSANISANTRLWRKLASLCCQF